MPTPIPNIWQLQSRGDIDALVEALRHPEASVRKGAAAALRALGAWQAVPALEAAIAVEQDWQAHAALTASLQYLDRDIHIETMRKNKDVRGLAKMLTSPKIEDVVTACEALGSLGERQAVEPLVMVFRNPLMPNPARLAAAEALLKLESAPAVVTLLGALRRDNWQVRRNAAAVLGQLQASWATQPLIDALKDPNLTVRKTASAALHRINTPEGVRAAKAFDEALAKIGTQEMLQAEQRAAQQGANPAAQSAGKQAAPAQPKAAPVQATPSPTTSGQAPAKPETVAVEAPKPTAPSSGETTPQAPTTAAPQAAPASPPHVQPAKLTPSAASFDLPTAAVLRKVTGALPPLPASHTAPDQKAQVPAPAATPAEETKQASTPTSSAAPPPTLPEQDAKPQDANAQDTKPVDSAQASSNDAAKPAATEPEKKPDSDGKTESA